QSHRALSEHKTLSVSWSHYPNSGRGASPPGIVDQQIREKLIKHMKYRRLLFFKVSRDVCI
ncbi:hypothetical protein MZI56_25095, partial [Escherichia coli]|nr:hypothetical protein [Escherichia coli]